MNINMDITEKLEIPKKLPEYMMLTEDNKANFMCGFVKEEVGNSNLISSNKEYISLENVDYMLDVKTDEPEPEFDNSEIIATENTTEDKQKTLSYLSVKSVEEGIEWYKKEFPKIPDELLPMMSRWNFGNLNEETKKSIKNKNKKLNKKKKNKKQNQENFKIEHKPVLIRFD